MLRRVERVAETDASLFAIRAAHLRREISGHRWRISAAPLAQRLQVERAGMIAAGAMRRHPHAAFDQ